MKKVYVNKITQKEVTFYSMIVDPRLIAKIRRKYTAGEAQDVQRPWELKKVKEISEYVAGKTKVEGKKSLGLIPNTPILNFKNKINVNKEGDRFYIELPTTQKEIDEYQGQLEIIDGQHRIIAFDDEYLDPDFKNDTTYEMCFTFFDNISDNQRKEIFMVTNEKQDKVKTNLLRYIKKSLGLLVGNDIIMYDIIEHINEESSSPLYHRIMFGSEKISKGYQESQITKIFNKYGALDFYNDRVKELYPDNSVETFSEIVNNYFNAWEKVCSVKFNDPGKRDTITKISGVRYIMCLFKDLSCILLDEEKMLTEENYVQLIKEMPLALEFENAKFIFCDDTSGGAENLERRLAFRGEGATTVLAKDDLAKLRAHHAKTKGNFKLI